MVAGIKIKHFLRHQTSCRKFNYKLDVFHMWCYNRDFDKKIYCNRYRIINIYYVPNLAFKILEISLLPKFDQFSPIDFYPPDQLPFFRIVIADFQLFTFRLLVCLIRNRMGHHPKIVMPFTTTTDGKVPDWTPQAIPRLVWNKKVCDIRN